MIVSIDHSLSAFAVVRLQYIPGKLIVYDNAAATPNNIVAHESLFQFGIVSYLLAAAGWIFVTLPLYRLFKEVDQGFSVLMVILGCRNKNSRMRPTLQPKGQVFRLFVDQVVLTA